MARRVTLGKLLNSLRAECRLSLNPAHNSQVRDGHVEILQRTQEWLWEDFDWPHLIVERPLTIQAGQRYYSLPDDIPIDRVHRIEFRWGSEWSSLVSGIGQAQYAAWDSDADVRSWPIERWRITEDEQIELWPIPSDNVDGLEGSARVVGVKRLQPLVDDADRADLDDRLIILFAAAEHLAARGEKDAKFKLDQATKRYLRLRGNLQPSRPWRLFGGGAGDRVPYQAHIPRIHYRDRETG